MAISQYRNVHNFRVQPLIQLVPNIFKQWESDCCKAEYSRTVQSAFREVLDALQGQSLILGVRDANSEQVASLTRATELAELRYAQGDISYTDLLDVRRGLFAAQIDLVAAERDALLNTVDLALAVGAGLGDKGEPLSAKR